MITTKCPACSTDVPAGSAPPCPRCGRIVRSYFKGMSEEEKSLYVKKLALAIRNSAAQGHGSQPTTEPDRAPEPVEGRVESPSRAESRQKVYSESTPIPVLERDEFEYPEEFQARLEEHPPVVAGSAQMVKEEYDLKSKVFPVKVQWQDWVKPLVKQRLVSSAYIFVDRDLARSIYLAGSTHPVYARLRVEGEGPIVAGVELFLFGKVIPIEMGLQEKRPALSHRPWKEPITGMEFVPVQAGCYLMGSGDWDGNGHPHERPVHEVCLGAFWMGKFPVTQGEWKKVMGSNPCYFKLGDRYPVECVSWLDVRQFIKKLTLLNDGLYTFRLPTEAEWEYACRSGGRPEKYAGGSKETGLDESAWHSLNSGGTPQQVGTKKPNGLDLCDMSGNVWEWCEDIYGDTVYDRHHRNNPLWCTGEPDRVIRGGSWYSEAHCARCSSRGFLDQTYRRHFVGFRLVRIPMNDC